VLKKMSLDKKVNAAMKKIDNADENSNELHTVLHPELRFTLNSHNVLVGQTGAGKTRTVFWTIAKLKFLPYHPYTQVVYVTDEENDKTFAKYKRLIPIPIVKIGLDEAYETLTDIIDAKIEYEKLWQTKKMNDKVRELLAFLGVKNFKLPFIHTLILFDDATEIFNQKKYNDLVGLFLKNRHHKFTYFFNIHNWTRNALPMKIKKNVRSVWYFGGYSLQDFNSSFPQMKSPMDRLELYDIYKKLGKRDVLYFDHAEEGTRIEILNLG
jgi:hypothetical protein